MPGDRARACLKERLVALVTFSSVDEMDLGVSSGRPGRRMNVVPPEVPAPLQRVLDGQLGEVLPTEGDDLALGYKAGQLVLARARELGELDTANFAPNGWRQVDDLGLGWEEVLEGGVRILPVFVVLEGRQGRIFLARVPRGKVVGILFPFGGARSVKLMKRCGSPLSYAWHGAKCSRRAGEGMRRQGNSRVWLVGPLTLAALMPSFLPSSASLSTLCA